MTKRDRSGDRDVFQQFLHDDTGCSSYFIASRQSREAAVIDPQYDVLPYLDLTAERGYTITGVIDGAKASVIWGAEDEIDK